MPLIRVIAEDEHSFRILESPTWGLPTFKDYPVKEIFRGKVVKARIKSPEAKTYRTVITQEAKKGPNFAGHYTIVQWGCGTACSGFAIVDAKTGDVYIPNFYVSMGYGLDSSLQEHDLLDYKIGSRLLVVTGSRNEKGQGQYFYTWENRQLILKRTAFEVKD